MMSDDLVLGGRAGPSVVEETGEGRGRSGRGVGARSEGDAAKGGGRRGVGGAERGLAIEHERRGGVLAVGGLVGGGGIVILEGGEGGERSRSGRRDGRPLILFVFLRDVFCASGGDEGLSKEKVQTVSD